MNSVERILILGCGYLGNQLSKLALFRGYKVDALTRNTETLKELEVLGVQKRVADQLSSADWHLKFHPADYRAIFVTVGSSESTPEGYTESYLRGLESVMTWSGDYTGKIIYTSSISVYGSNRGNWIDESTQPDPGNWRGNIIWKSEEIVRSHPTAEVIVLRLGGIYGPGRDRFLKHHHSSGNPGEADYFLNLIHVKDAAFAMLELMESNRKLESIYNLTDNQPVKKATLNEHILKFHPESVTSDYPYRQRRAPENRRVCSEKIQEHLHWKPAIPSVLANFSYPASSE